MAAYASYRYGVDWDRDGFINWTAAPGDALNLLASPLAWSGIGTLAINSATVAFVDVETDYGQRGFRITSGTHVNGGGAFGHGATGGASTIPLDAATAYTAVVWIKGVSDYTGIGLTILCIDQAYTLLGVTTATLTGDWQRVAISFTSDAGSTHFYWHMQKSNSATEAVWDASGFMLVAGGVAPAGFNIGAASNRYDNLSAWVQRATWRLGFTQAFTRVADDVEAELALNNHDRLFSPDYASGPLYGLLLPQRRLVIESVYSGTTRRHFTGFLHSLRPAPGSANGTLLATLRAVGFVEHLKATELTLPLMENTTAEAVIEAVVNRTNLPPATLGGIYWTWDVPGRNTWDSGAMRFSDPTAVLALDVGRNTYPYVGDTWDKITSAFDAITSVAEAERGKVYVDRDGKLNFKNRAWLQVKTSVDATITNPHGVDYIYGADALVNAVRVNAYPRAISDSATDELWTLDEPVTVKPRSQEEVRARWVAAEGERVGAKDVVAPNTGDGSLVSDPAGITAGAYEIDARGATITLVNGGGRTRDVTTLIWRGRRITSANVMSRTAIDTTSIAAYGRRELSLDLKLVADPTFAQAVAEYELRQRKDARGLAASVTLLDKDGTYLTHCLARTVGDRITLSEGQTGHSADYFVVGERHEVVDNGRLHACTLYLEPVPLAPCWLWDVPGRSAFDTATATFAL